MKRRRIAGVCIALAAVVFAGTIAVSGNNTKDKNQTKDDSTKEKFTKDMIYMQKIYLRKKVKNQKKKQKENTAGSSIITSCNTLKSFI